MAIRLRKKHCIIYILVVSLASFVIFSYFANSHMGLVEEMNDQRVKRDLENFQDEGFSKQMRLTVPSFKTNEEKEKRTNNIEAMKILGKDESTSLSKSSDKGSQDMQAEKSKSGFKDLISYDFHIFYYPWYKNPAVDGAYAHWDHELLPHWSDKSSSSQRRRKHTPPGDIGANFYPSLGPYSSKDPSIVNSHMKQIRDTGAGVMVVSWYPPHHEKDVETPVDSLMHLLFDAAHNHSLKVAFHVEPYKDRSGLTLRDVMKYIFQTYGNHPAFYRKHHKGKQLPVVYIYDSYQIEAKEWATALKPDGRHSVRGTDIDAVFIGLLVERQHFGHLLASGFDGFYTYFASNGFSYGSTWTNWPFIAKEAAQKNLLFIPSIGPGYLDTRVRPWNGKNTKPRLHGKYYRGSFDSAMKVKPKILSVTSFNEWHEGTQIEAAVPKVHAGYKYEDYWPQPPEFYIDLTKQFVREYHQNMTAIVDHPHEDAL